MKIALLMALILFNGLFAMAEIALVTARRTRLQRMAQDGDRAALVAMRLGEEPTQFLSTIQIGITAIGILNGIVGEAVLAGPLAHLLQGLGMAGRASGIVATTIVVATVTYCTIVIGELVPKRIAQFNAEGIARALARPIALLAGLSRPFVFLLAVSTDGILRLLGKRELSSANLTEEDIHDMLVEGSRAGIIEKHEHEMVRNVFRLDDRAIPSLMTPRSEIVYLDIDQPFQQNLDKVITSNHSRFPVCRGGLEDILGIISAKRLLKRHLQGEPPDLMEEYLLPAVYVPESMTGMKLLEQFRASGVQMVFVVDEYGEILGLVTLQDILEAVAGEFKPRDPEDVWAVRRRDGSWLLDGLIPLPELKDRLDLKSVPEEDKGRYHTLSGMMMWLIGKVPGPGDVTEWEGWRLEVMDLDGNRIDKVLASRQPQDREE
ncbi:MAG: hemolysin family protein [Syntrophotaleaceae bacterium]